jgi:restriction endonuclease S subunit
VRFVQIRDFGERGEETYIPMSKRNKICRIEDVLIGRYGASIGRICSGLDGAYNVALLKCIPDNERILNKFLFQILNHNIVQKRIIELSDRAAQAGVSPDDLKEFQIPLPTLEIQEQIVAEIEVYQKIIDGAKMVVDNYKPTIKINPEWEMVELGEVCDVRDGTHDSPKYILEGGIPFVTQKNITKDGLSFDDVNNITEEEYLKIKKRSNVEFGDILFSMIGANRGMSCIVDDKRIFSIKNVGLIKSIDKINQNFLLTYLKSQTAQDYVDLMSSGGAQQFIGLTSLRKFPIPLPSDEEQTKVVEKIEAEQQLIDANKNLITIYEQKIKDKINEVWGVEENVEI